MKYSISNSNRPGPHHSAGGPAIGGAQKGCKTYGFETGRARNFLKQKVSNKVLCLKVSGQGKFEFKSDLQKNVIKLNNY